TKDRTREGDDLVRGAVRRDCVEMRRLQARVGVYAEALAAGCLVSAGCCQRQRRISPAIPKGRPIPLMTHTTQVIIASTAPQSCFWRNPTTARPWTPHRGIER